MTAAPALSASAQTQGEDDSHGERIKRHPMNWAGIGVKVGMAGTSSGSFTLHNKGESFTGRVGARRGLMVSMPINLGGDGFGWMIEPSLGRSSMAHNVTDSTGVVTGSQDIDLMAYGLYTGPTINFHVANPLYIGVGLGIKAAYIVNRGFDLALDAYGRVPVSATYYVSNQLALVAEMGVGYGASLFANDKSPVSVDKTGTKTQNHNDLQFGRAVAWDCSFGVRLP